jgi:hypothetical protein
VRSASGSSEGRSVEQGGSESDGSESDVPGSSSTSSSRGIVEALDDAAGTPAVSGSLRAEMDIEAVGRTQKVRGGPHSLYIAAYLLMPPWLHRQSPVP